MTRAVLLTSLRNEGPFLLEWVAYHRLIGFDEVIICFNHCDDGSAEMLAALQDIGWIIALPNSRLRGLAPQTVAAQRIMECGRIIPGDWVIWLDMDEFLNIHEGDRTIAALIKALAWKKAMVLAWRLFGDGNGAEFGGRFIDARFQTASTRDNPDNWVPKTLFRFDENVTALTIHRPNYAKGSAPAYREVVIGDRSRLPANMRNNRWLLEGGDGYFQWLHDHECRWDMAQINHYTVRTRALYALKRWRGRGMVQGKWSSSSKNTRHTPAFFDQMNRNEEVDTSILHWADRVTVVMDEALANPAIRAAQDLIDTRLAAELARLP